jgi:hypothetical protein
MLAFALGIASSLDAALAADTVVLYAGNPDSAVHRVAADTQRPIWEMAPFRLSERISGDRPRGFGADQPEPCDGDDSTNADLTAMIGKVEGRMTYEQWDQAKADLDAASMAVACLSEPADPALGARIYFLAGITATALADPAGANGAYLKAFAFQPALQWDDTFTPDWQAQFDSALSEHNRRGNATVVLGPGMEGQSSLWVDGKMVPVSGNRLTLPEGAHLVQVLEPSVRTTPVRVDAHRTVAIAVPAKISDSLVERANDTAAQPLLDALIDHVFGEQSVYLWTGSQTVRGGAGWEALPPKFDPGAESRKTLGGKLVMAGTVAAGTGVAVTAVGLAAFLPNAKAKPGEVGEAYTHRVQTAARGAGLATGGLATVAVGVVTLGIGIPIALSGNAADVGLAPMWVEGGGGVVVSVLER